MQAEEEAALLPSKGKKNVYVGFLMYMLFSSVGPAWRNWLFHVHCVTGMGSVEGFGLRCNCQENL